MLLVTFIQTDATYGYVCVLAVFAASSNNPVRFAEKPG